MNGKTEDGMSKKLRNQSAGGISPTHYPIAAGGRLMEKSFNCLKMKEDVQQKLLHRFDGMNASQMNAAIDAELSASQTPAGRFWRLLTAQSPSKRLPLAVCEKRDDYTATT